MVLGINKVNGILCDEEIKRRIYIDPFALSSEPHEISYGLSSYGYDFRLGYKFAKVHHGIGEFDCIDPKNSKSSYLSFEEKGPFYLEPHSFILGVSLEYFKIPRDCIGICLGKSTYARNGIHLLVTPLEPEWEGYITLEIVNLNERRVMIYPGEGIGQILFLSAEKVCNKSYNDKKNSHYQKQKDLTFSSIYSTG